MKLLPAVLIIVSFLVICFGVYLKSINNTAASYVIAGGMMGEGIFIVLNRVVMARRRDQH